MYPLKFGEILTENRLCVKLALNGYI